MHNKKLRSFNKKYQTLIKRCENNKKVLKELKVYKKQ